MTPSKKNKHDRIIRNLAHKIRSLSRELRAAKSRGLNEAHAVRKGAEPMIEGMRAETERVRALYAELATVARSLEGVGYDGLIRFGEALGAGRWRRFWWGIRFGITGRV